MRSRRLCCDVRKVRHFRRFASSASSCDLTFLGGCGIMFGLSPHSYRVRRFYLCLPETPENGSKKILSVLPFLFRELLTHFFASHELMSTWPACAARRFAWVRVSPSVSGTRRRTRAWFWCRATPRDVNPLRFREGLPTPCCDIFSSSLSNSCHSPQGNNFVLPAGALAGNDMR